MAGPTNNAKFKSISDLMENSLDLFLYSFQVMVATFELNKNLMQVLESLLVLLSNSTELFYVS